MLSSTTLWSLGSMRKQQLQESRLSPATSPGSSWDSEDYLIFSIQRTVSGSPQLYLIISWLGSAGDGIKSLCCGPFLMCWPVEPQRATWALLFCSQRTKTGNSYYFVPWLLCLAIPHLWCWCCLKIREGAGTLTVVTKGTSHLLCPCPCVTATPPALGAVKACTLYHLPLAHPSCWLSFKHPAQGTLPLWCMS